MNEQEQLKLQAYLDGELTGRDREEVAKWLETREDARALLAELQYTRTTLREGEPERGLDCSREFYWSGIARGIESAEQEPATGGGFDLFAWLRRHLTQVAGTAAAIALALVTLVVLESPSTGASVRAESEWEVLHPSTGMVNYRDYQNGITVVMLYDRTTPGFTSGN